MASFYRKLGKDERRDLRALCPEKNYKYVLTQKIVYTDKKGRSVTCQPGMFSDGATGALDIASKSWWFHDALCNRGKWDDGTPCNNIEASIVLSSCLFSEWSIKKPLRGVRAILWLPATWLGGGGAARKNGMW